MNLFIILYIPFERTKAKTNKGLLMFLFDISALAENIQAEFFDVDDDKLS